MAVHILGIRHHGVGSAKMVEQRLLELQPDIVLIEGPPEITPQLQWMGHHELQPPVALLVYDSKSPKLSTFYPFAAYSPEWIAAKYANNNAIPVRAIDLPAAISFKQVSKVDEEETIEAPETPYKDPISYLAEADGFDNGETWWNYYFEQNNQDAASHFESISVAMNALREAKIESYNDAENELREAFMRKGIQQAINELYDNIVVVCGAWHAPALEQLEDYAKQDIKTLKKAPKSRLKIEASWIPWTNKRLSMYSGYGAGIQSPGWYEHLWNTTANIEVKWLTNTATTFRKNGIDISTAHVIEASKLAYQLAQLRNKYHTGLAELNEATLAVMCMGDGILFKYIEEQLIIGDRLGSTPEDIPKVPLQLSFEQTVKSLRLKFELNRKEVVLDLRQPAQLKKSIFFHQLQILELDWVQTTFVRGKGTYKEGWVLEWRPEMMVTLIDKAALGNTVEIAAANYILEQTSKAKQINELTKAVERCLPATLLETITTLLQRINTLATIATDLADLLKALPALIRLSRYGDVRQSDTTTIDRIIEQLMTKVLVGLPTQCYGLDEEHSTMFFELIANNNQAIRLYENEQLLQQWYNTLLQVLDKSGVHPLIKGCVCRLLLDAQQLTTDEVNLKMSFALSQGNEPIHSAAWIEGFLKGDAMILIYDQAIWNLLYDWVAQLEQTQFMELLPLLRRAFSKFEFNERQQIGQKAKQEGTPTTEITTTANPINEVNAAKIVPTLAHLIGFTTEQ